MEFRILSHIYLDIVLTNWAEAAYVANEFPTEFRDNRKNDYGWTPLHLAADYGYLNQIPALSAKFLVAKTKHGFTPPHCAADSHHLDQITDLSITITATVGILRKALWARSISVFTEDFRRNGADYNHRPQIRNALLAAAHALPRLRPSQRTAVKAAICAAQEGGFVLPPETLIDLL